jgi:hypothetical protein
MNRFWNPSFKYKVPSKTGSWNHTKCRVLKDFRTGSNHCKFSILNKEIFLSFTFLIHSFYCTYLVPILVALSAYTFYCLLDILGVSTQQRRIKQQQSSINHAKNPSQTNHLLPLLIEYINYLSCSRVERGRG